METTTNWHRKDEAMPISQLVIEECEQDEDGRLSITVTCSWLGGDILLEIVRTQEEVLAIYSLSEKTAELWSANLGFKFVENNWQVIESTRTERPYVAGIVFSRESPQLLGDAVEESFNWLQPDNVKTGKYAITEFLYPKDDLPAS